MKRKIYFIGILLFFLISGCTTVEYYFRGRSLAQEDQISSNSMIYALPRTTLYFHIEARKTVFKHGPFYRYAEKYLGITETSEEDWESWSLSGIEIQACESIDPEEYYLLESNGPLEMNAIALSKAGLILAPRTDPLREQPVISSIISEKPERIFYTDLSVKRNTEMVTDTNYRFIDTDTGFVRVPYLYEREERKTLEEKAEEAANFIIKIRKRRFKLMSGQYDVFPEGIALEYAVTELTKLEQEYVALFTGKSYTEVVQASYEFTPGNEPEERPYVLCRFSTENGLLPRTDLTGKPLLLDLTPEGITKIIDDLEYRDPVEGEEINKALFYRVPEMVHIRILDDQDVLAEKKVLIYQFGKTIKLPVNFILK